MQLELLRVVAQGVLSAVLVYAPDVGCTDLVIADLPWWDTTENHTLMDIEGSCRVTYRAHTDEIPNYLRGYDVWRVNREGNRGLRKTTEPYIITLEISGVTYE